ncbi:MAG: SGNH/GDSL hydrolase family protein [Clostridia bacterium]|nr:SGNH/GDSL hydrolase family protein [Clostridia bacterium]
MRVKDKLAMSTAELVAEGPITIVAFGDSITHGALGPDEINYETVYWNRLKQKLNAVRNYVPINVINAGIGGLTAKLSVARIDRDVLSHHPDLVIVCFGLNDVNLPLNEYIEALTIIFEKCKQSGAEVIFMTPNMLNTRVAPDTDEPHLEYAAKTAAFQNEGRMDAFMDAAVRLANAMEIAVCDCYAEWKKLSQTQDVTPLLANRINHPCAEMHSLFADMLFEKIMGNTKAPKPNDSSTMYHA